MITTPRYHRIHTTARTLRWLILASMMAVAFLGIYPLINPLRELTLLPRLITKIDAAGIADADLNLARWLSLLSKAALLYGFYRLVEMMRACERGDLFSPQVPAHLLWFSIAIVVVELLHIFLPLQVALVHVIAGHAHGPIMLIIRSEQLFLLQLALLFMILAAMLREAARIAEDNAAIV